MIFRLKSFYFCKPVQRRRSLARHEAKIYTLFQTSRQHITYFIPKRKKNNRPGGKSACISFMWVSFPASSISFDLPLTAHPHPHPRVIPLTRKRQVVTLHTVKPPLTDTSRWRTPLVSGHPRDQKKWPLKRGVRLWEVKSVVFVCSWKHDQVSAYEGYPPTGGVH